MTETRITLRADESIRALAKELAAAENRNLSNYIINLILADAASKERAA